MKIKRCAICLDTYTPGKDVQHGKSPFTACRLVEQGICPICAKKRLEGFIAMIGIDPEKSNKPEEDSYVNHDGMFRTGNVGFLMERAWVRMFNPDPPTEGICFVDDEILYKLNEFVYGNKEGEAT